jgi:D-glycero-beta-D-manno-heptose 1-phosphate adenylyltransferase
VGQVVTWAEVQQLAERLRRDGNTLVFTNGVFDLLHVGHVRYLRAARELGDAMLVGLNSDVSARGLKGVGRPIVRQEERAEVLAALECVDWVLIFDQPTAVDVVLCLRPEIYVKGGDYGHAPNAAPLPEAPAVQSYGGRVVLLPYTLEHSTSVLIRRICDTFGQNRE